LQLEVPAVSPDGASPAPALRGRGPSPGQSRRGQVLAHLRPSPPCHPLAQWLPGCWAGQCPEATKRPNIHRGKCTEGCSPQALVLPPPRTASWLRGRGNSSLLLCRPICTPGTESPRCAHAAGRAAGGRTAAAAPPGRDPQLRGRCRGELGLQRAVHRAGRGTIPSLGVAKGGEMEWVQWSSHTHGNCS